MEKELYSMIFKRKSFHIFRDIGNINPDELQSIEEKYNNLTPLINGIQTAIRIVPADQTTCRRGQEYCILLYSEKKDNYLQNIGYIGEQLDLYLAS
ncbi:MAG: nitroreductase family protein, partial [Agathobacter sp.]|nr:nitroreductase family protein [Agathobacter sp.]